MRNIGPDPNTIGTRDSEGLSATRPPLQLIAITDAGVACDLACRTSAPHSSVYAVEPRPCDDPFALAHAMHSGKHDHIRNPCPIGHTRAVHDATLCLRQQ